ncbi:MAG: RnfABCDGE type electron transport complex subunit D [Oscillospiraceae bacterium]|nr:RnfABCDGE type electron transport complex subunit D [Oscillospiraceae bacterium]
MPKPNQQPRWKQRLATNRDARRWNLTSLALTLPLLLLGYFYYGVPALHVAVVSVLAAVLAELVFGRIFLHKNTLGDWNAVVVGLWIALMLPAFIVPPEQYQMLGNYAVWYAALGSVFAILVVKIPFGGTKHMPFSPAAAGFAFLTACFPHRVFTFVPSEVVAPVRSRSMALLLNLGENAITPDNLPRILFGHTVGPMGTGVVLVLVVMLAVMLLLKSRRSYAMASVGFIMAVAGLAFLFPRITPGVEGMTMSIRVASIGMELFSGSLLFAAIFLLQEPSTLPGRGFTRLAFGALAGAVAILLRRLGTFEENVVFAILLANAMLPMIYRIQDEALQQKIFRRKQKTEETEVADAQE